MGPYTLFFLMLSGFLGLTLLCVKPLGSYMADVMQGKPNFARRVGGPVEGLLYRICGVDSRNEMAWPQYAAALLLFNVLGAVIVCEPVDFFMATHLPLREMERAGRLRCLGEKTLHRFC